MKLLYVRLSAVALVASVLATAGGSLFAQPMHAICLAQRHDCTQTAKISTCCCGNQRTARHEGTPVPTRAEVRVDRSMTQAVTSGVQVATAPHVSHVVTSPPRLCRLDLPTLFACLLI